MEILGRPLLACKGFSILNFLQLYISDYGNNEGEKILLFHDKANVIMIKK